MDKLEFCEPNCQHDMSEGYHIRVYDAATPDEYKRIWCLNNTRYPLKPTINGVEYTLRGKNAQTGVLEEIE